MILYSNGCSMAEGAELGNNIFGFDEHNNCSSLPRQRIATLENYDNKDVHIEYIDKHCYSGVLKESMKFSSAINDAISGSSNANILERTIMSIEKLLASGVKNTEIFAIISWTDFDRSYVPLDWDRCVNIAPHFPKNSGAPWSFNSMVASYHKIISSNLHFLFKQYLLDVIHLQNFFKAKSIKCLFIQGVANHIISEFGKDDANRLQNDETIRSLFSIVDMEQWFTNNNTYSVDCFSTSHRSISFSEFNGMHKYKVGKMLHPLEDGHREWAIKLEEHIRNNYELF